MIRLITLLLILLFSSCKYDHFEPENENDFYNGFNFLTDYSIDNIEFIDNSLTYTINCQDTLFTVLLLERKINDVWQLIDTVNSYSYTFEKGDFIYHLKDTSTYFSSVYESRVIKKVDITSISLRDTLNYSYNIKDESYSKYLDLNPLTAYNDYNYLGIVEKTSVSSARMFFHEQVTDYMESPPKRYTANLFFRYMFYLLKKSPKALSIGIKFKNASTLSPSFSISEVFTNSSPSYFIIFNMQNEINQVDFWGEEASLFLINNYNQTTFEITQFMPQIVLPIHIKRDSLVNSKSYFSYSVKPFDYDSLFIDVIAYPETNYFSNKFTDKTKNPELSYTYSNRTRIYSNTGTFVYQTNQTYGDSLLYPFYACIIAYKNGFINDPYTSFIKFY